MTWRRKGERGTMAVEMVILTPVLMMLVLLIVAAGRYVSIRGDVEATARDAARAASLEDSHAQASGIAHQVVQKSLESDTNCTAVSLDTATWHPAGSATVRMRCEVSYEGLGLIGLPGSIDINVDSSAPLDPYRRYE